MVSISVIFYYIMGNIDGCPSYIFLNGDTNSKYSILSKIGIVLACVAYYSVSSIEVLLVL